MNEFGKQVYFSSTKAQRAEDRKEHAKHLMKLGHSRKVAVKKAKLAIR
jgi:hypothetical protein